jgi:glycosyltransferase involved in cell wall biosynthesis
VARLALVHDLIGGAAGGGGGVRLMLELAVNLRARGHDVVLVCHDYQPSEEFEQLSAGLEIRAVREGVAELAQGRRRRSERYWAGMRRVAALVPDDVDVVNAHDFPALRAGRLAAQRIGAPFLWTRNDDTGWERAVIPQMTSGGAGRPSRRPLHLAVGLLDRRDARRAESIIVLSDHDAAMVKKAYGRRAEVIRSGPAEAFFAPTADRAGTRDRLGVGKDEFLVLAFALLVPYRRFEDLIEATALVRDLGDVRLRIVGSDHLSPAYGDRLERTAVATGLGDRIILDRRAISDTELRALYNAADLFVFPSSRQSYGLAPLEALASGTSVVVSRGAGVHEILDGRPGVSVVAPGHPDEIAAAIREVHGHRDDAGVQQTRAWVRDALSNQRYAERMEELVEQTGRLSPDHAASRKGRFQPAA